MKRVIIISKTAQVCITTLMSILMIVCTVSCKKDQPDEPEPDEPQEQYGHINEWILENMQIYYLWNTRIPSRTDMTLFPADYFESILYRPTDRYSWIEEDFVGLLNSLSGVNTEAGYDFNLLLMSGNRSEIIAYITYIKPGTPAEAAGLKRGDYFHQINGTQMTIDNYSELIGATSKAHDLGMSIISDNTITGVKNVPLSVVENYSENPILMDTIYNMDKKIGYFVYNFFARDNGDNSARYEKELNALFGKFNDAQIDELIVDLRYNGGGAVITAEALAKMLSGQSDDNVFYRYEYNYLIHNESVSEFGEDYNKSFFINTIDRYDSKGKIVESIPITSLSGVSTVYFIVTNRSASASELIINGLRPYMNIVLVGGTTYGKNVGSFTIYEQDPEKQKTNTWGMQPIVMKIANSEGFSDYEDGFIPDVEAYEHHADPIRVLGDTAELLLSTTLKLINGEQTESQAMTKHFDGRATFIGSSIDKTPARQNMYITPKDLPSNRRNR
jgi:C-terminal processing protease CtpA/Prc